MIPRFRVWDKNRKTMAPLLVLRFDPEGVQLDAVHVLPENGNDYFDFADSFVLMLSTGLKDKNGVVDIFEGDIIDIDGRVKGNVYESPSLLEDSANLVVAGMGTRAWRDTESIAVGRGCFYS